MGSELIGELERLDLEAFRTRIGSMRCHEPKPSQQSEKDQERESSGQVLKAGRWVWGGHAEG